MGLYRINVLGVQGINQKVYGPSTVTKYGKGIVSDDMFPEGNAKALAKSKHLVELKGKELTEANKNAKDDAAKKEADKKKKEALKAELLNAEKSLNKGLEDLEKETDEEAKKKLAFKVEDLKVEVEVARENLAEFIKLSLKK